MGNSIEHIKKNGVRINTNSWHYWLVCKVRGWRGAPSSLCPYMRWLLWGIIVAIILGGCGLLIASALVCAPIAWFTTLIDLPEETMTLTQFLAVLGTVLWGLGAVIGTIAGVAVLWQWIDDKRYMRSQNRFYARDDEPEEPEPGLLRMWWTIVHHKICPMLEFK